MSNPLLSVVVPVYNVKPFLRKCVESLVAQTYENMEIILVDDGSKDGSGDLCDELCEEQKRQSSEMGGRQSSIKDFVVIHKSNGGLSSARNAGIAAAKGDLICFIDSDDWVVPNAYKDSIESLIKYDADVIQYNLVLTSSEDYVIQNEKEEIIEFQGKDILQYYMDNTTRTTGGYSMCRVICKKDLINGVCFREGKINEDIDFKYKMLSKANKLIITNQSYYLYRQGNISTSCGGLKRKDFDLRDATEALYDLAKDETYGNIKQLAEVKKARTAFSLLCKIAYFGIADETLDRKQVVKELTKEHRSSLMTLLKAPLPLSRKICAILLAIDVRCLELPLKLVGHK